MLKNACQDHTTHFLGFFWSVKVFFCVSRRKFVRRHVIAYRVGKNLDFKIHAFKFVAKLNPQKFMLICHEKFGYFGNWFWRGFTKKPRLSILERGRIKLALWFVYGTIYSTNYSQTIFEVEFKSEILVKVPTLIAWC